MEINRLPEIQPDRDRSKPALPRRQRGAPARKTPAPSDAAEQAAEPVERPAQSPAEPRHRVDVTA